MKSLSVGSDLDETLFAQNLLQLHAFHRNEYILEFEMVSNVWKRGRVEITLENC